MKRARRRDVVGWRATAAQAIAAAVAVRAGYSALARLMPPVGRERAQRINYRGRPVTLLGGVAVALGALCAVGADRRASPLLRRAALVAGSGAALAGCLDDFRGNAEARGLRGHLTALGQGSITTGGLKIAGIGASGLVAGCLATRGGWSRRLAAGATVAAAANVANLLDLRPGRAAKAVLLVAAPVAATGGAGAPVAAVACGAAAGILPLDLREQVMLGDVGANTLGALVGVGLVAGARGRRVAASLSVLSALTIASEFVSFSRVIDAQPWLRRLDRWGRRSARPDGDTAVGDRAGARGG